MKGKTVVFSLIPLQDSLLVTLNAKPGEFTYDNVEDISNKGHWGVGNYRMKIEAEADIWAALDYIQHISKCIK